MIGVAIAPDAVPENAMLILLTLFAKVILIHMAVA